MQPVLRSGRVLLPFVHREQPLGLTPPLQHTKRICGALTRLVERSADRCDEYLSAERLVEMVSPKVYAVLGLRFIPDFVALAVNGLSVVSLKVLVASAKMLQENYRCHGGVACKLRLTPVFSFFQALSDFLGCSHDQRHCDGTEEG